MQDCSRPKARGHNEPSRKLHATHSAKVTIKLFYQGNGQALCEIKLQTIEILALFEQFPEKFSWKIPEKSEV